jgi:hypothetical protein
VYNTAQYLYYLLYTVFFAHLYQGCQSLWRWLCLSIGVSGVLFCFRGTCISTWSVFTKWHWVSHNVSEAMWDKALTMKNKNPPSLWCVCVTYGSVNWAQWTHTLLLTPCIWKALGFTTATPYKCVRLHRKRGKDEDCWSFHVSNTLHRGGSI